MKTRGHEIVFLGVRNRFFNSRIGVKAFKKWSIKDCLTSGLTQVE